MRSLLEQIKIIKNVESQLKNPNNFGSIIIDRLHSLLNDAKVKSCYIVGGFSRDLLLKGDWYEIEGQFHEHGRDIDLWVNNIDRSRLSTFLKNNLNREIKVLNIDQYKIQLLISFEEYNRKIKVDIGSFNYKLCNIRGSSIAYDLIKKKYKRDIFTFTLIYNFLIKRQVHLSEKHLGLRKDPNDYYADDIFDLLYHCEKNSFCVSKSAVDRLKKVNKFLRINSDIYLNRMATRNINISRRYFILMERFQKIVTFCKFLELENIELLVRNLHTKISGSILNPEPHMMDSSKNYIIAQRSNNFYNDYDFMNFCRTEEYENSIFLYLSTRGILSNVLEIGYHNGLDWIVNKYPLNIEKDSIKVEIKQNIFKVYLNHISIFYTSIEEEKYVFFNRDLKRNNKYGCRFEVREQ